MSLTAAQYAHRYGNPLDRILDRMLLDERGCLLWTGTCTPAGYGQVRIGTRNVLLHRLLFETFRGAIPPDLQIDHLCRIRHCANPWHLRLATVRQNVLAGIGITAINATKTHCANGHEFNETNTRITKRGHRACRPCQAERERARRQRDPEKAREQVRAYRQRQREKTAP